MAEEERNPTVKEIVSEFLKLNGYEGVFNEDLPCACKLDELFCCDDYCSECEAGYIVPCEDEPDSEFNYCLGREKPE